MYKQGNERKSRILYYTSSQVLILLLEDNININIDYYISDFLLAGKLLFTCVQGRSTYGILFW